MIQREVNTVMTSSCGRLFDAVASLIGLRHRNAYEGQAPIELENLQHSRETGRYPWSIQEKSGTMILITSDIIKGIVEDLRKGVSRSIISRRFHNTLIRMFTEICVRLREESGIETVAMSGGAFQNATLLRGLAEALSHLGFKVLTHSKVPTNDGGLSLGQAVCAGLRTAGIEGKFHEIH
jgi:hydrogenase maturation protein HypF